MPLFGKKQDNISDAELVKIAEETNGLLRDTFQAYIDVEPQTTGSGEKTITSRNLPHIVSDFRGTLIGIAQNRPVLLQEERYRSILLKSPYSTSSVSNQFWWAAVNDALQPPKKA